MSAELLADVQLVLLMTVTLMTFRFSREAAFDVSMVVGVAKLVPVLYRDMAGDQRMIILPTQPTQKLLWYFPRLT